MFDQSGMRIHRAVPMSMTQRRAHLRESAFNYVYPNLADPITSQALVNNYSLVPLTMQGRPPIPYGSTKPGPEGTRTALNG